MWWLRFGGWNYLKAVVKVFPFVNLGFSFNVNNKFDINI